MSYIRLWDGRRFGIWDVFLKIIRKTEPGQGFVVLRTSNSTYKETNRQGAEGEKGAPGRNFSFLLRLFRLRGSIFLTRRLVQNYEFSDFFLFSAIHAKQNSISTP
jgi:hypothetical protein